jgi:hypothetical protein
MGVACSVHGIEENPYKILIRKPEEKRSFGRSRQMLEDNIRMYLTGVGWKGVDLICLDQKGPSNGLLCI